MSNKRVVIGIDYSITSPSLCIIQARDEYSFSFEECSFLFLTQTRKYSGEFLNGQVTGYFHYIKNYLSDIQRFNMISEIFMDSIRELDNPQIALEDYAFGAKGRVFNIGEHTGILKLKLFQAGFEPIHTIPPTVIKQFATGKGNADKDRMYDAFIAETDVDLKAALNYTGTTSKSPISDIVDSYYVAKYLYNIEET